MNMRTMQIKFEATLKAGIKHDSQANVYVTYAPALKVFSQGESKIQAKTALTDAVQMFLRVAYEKGELERVLHRIYQYAGVVPDGRHIESVRATGDVVEENVLEELNYDDIFDVDTSLQFAATIPAES